MLVETFVSRNRNLPYMCCEIDGNGCTALEIHINNKIGCQSHWTPLHSRKRIKPMLKIVRGQFIISILECLILLHAEANINTRMDSNHHDL